MSTPNIFADFHNADPQGRLRLNCVGTSVDLTQKKVELKAGLTLSLYSEDLRVDGTVEFSEEEHLWVAVIDWQAIQNVEQEVVVKIHVPDPNLNITAPQISPR